MTQHEPKPKLIGRDISYPVINEEGRTMGVRTYDVLDDDRELICACTSKEAAIAITGLLNEHRPNEWER